VGDGDEHPEHLVYLDAFYLDKYEVTTSRYAKFLEETGAEREKESETTQFIRGLLGKPKAKFTPRGNPAYWDLVNLSRHGNRPVVGVSWYDSQAYCDWAGKRLPTEAEWEKAARGTDGRTYPWGDEAPTSWRANYGKEYSEHLYSDVIQPVGSYEEGKSPFGVYDMEGNVWEWVADWYDSEYYANSPERNPTGPASGKYRVLRGGSWSNQPESLRSAYRHVIPPTYRGANSGVRCAQDAP